MTNYFKIVVAKGSYKKRNNKEFGSNRIFSSFFSFSSIQNANTSSEEPMSQPPKTQNTIYSKYQQHFLKVHVTY